MTAHFPRSCTDPMKIIKTLLPVFFVLLCLVPASCAQSAQNTPKVSVVRAKVLHHEPVLIRGTSFTPKHNVSSHLRKPDGTEYPILPIFTNDRGEFSHEIDTLILGPGNFELWVVDDASKQTSNVVKFEVTVTPVP